MPAVYIQRYMLVHISYLCTLYAISLYAFAIFTPKRFFKLLLVKAYLKDVALLFLTFPSIGLLNQVTVAEIVTATGIGIDGGLEAETGIGTVTLEGTETETEMETGIVAGIVITTGIEGIQTEGVIDIALVTGVVIGIVVEIGTEAVEKTETKSQTVIETGIGILIGTESRIEAEVREIETVARQKIKPMVRLRSRM